MRGIGVLAGFLLGAGIAVAEPDPWNVEAVSASARWTELVRRVRELHPKAGETWQPEAECRSALDAARLRREGDPVDLCISAALDALDGGHSEYKAPAALARERAASNPGRWVGIGLELGAKHRGTPLPVVRPIAGAPGERAGIRAADLIVEIDSVDILPLSMDETIDRLRGEPGSPISVTLLRGAQQERITLWAKRERIRLQSVTARRVDGALAYVRVRHFTEAAQNEFVDKVDALWRGATPPRGLILDLRTTQGGALDAVLNLVAYFAGARVPVLVSHRRGGAKVMHGTDARAGPPLRGDVSPWLEQVPLAVLVDDKTVAGSEALAQFLREQRAARLIGARTGGLAHLREFVRLPDEAGAIVVVGEMASPKGVRWAGLGLAPDIEIVAPGSPFEWGDADDTVYRRALELLRELKPSGT